MLDSQDDLLESAALVVRPPVQDLLAAFAANAKLNAALDDTILVLFLDCRLQRIITPGTDFPTMRTSPKHSVYPGSIKQGHQNPGGDDKRRLHECSQHELS